jgi:hypothetical protein
MVFISVLIVSMVMMMVTISVVNMTTTQTVTAEDEVRRLKAEILASGWISFAQEDFPNNTTLTEVMEGTTYTINATTETTGSGPLGTNPVNIVVDY